MTGIRNDLKFAIRQLRRSPGFAAAALVCLGLGVGAATAIFSVVNAVVLRPLPYEHSHRLQRVYSEWPTWPGGGMWRFWLSPPEFAALRRDNRAFESLEAWQTGGANLSAAGQEAVRINTAQVTGGMFSMLGVAPLRGRRIEPADDAEGAPLVIVLSYGLWQGAFGGGDSAVGREVLINGAKATVVGVMPRGFDFPPGESQPAEAWTPLQLTSRDMERWGNHRLSLLGRVKPGVSAAQASLDLDRLEREYGEADGSGTHRPNPRTHTLIAYPLLTETVGNVRPAMLLMLGATALVLLIACGNVANLLLARAQVRQREVAVRQAMGASSAGLLRQFFLEGLLLSLGGALLGLSLAFGILRLILAAGAANIPRASEVGIDWTVLLAALACALATGMIFGLAPLAQTLRTRVFDTLKSAGARTTATREAHWLRNTLVVGEIALALILLAGASLLLDSFRRMMQIDPGVRTDAILSMRVSLPMQTYPRPADVQRFWHEAVERIERLPGVGGVAILGGLPPQRPVNANDTFIEGLVPRPGGPIHNVDYWNGVSPGAFEMLGIPLLKGRYIDARDGESAPRVLVVNETFERTFYGGESALGRRVKPGGGPDDTSPWFTIVGVVKDMKNQGLESRAGTELFFSLAQAGAVRAGSLVVKSASGDPWTVVAPVRDAIRQIDASLPLAQVRPLEDVISASRARPRFLAILISLFGVLALGLAATGIFSVMTYTVAQRTGEFGLRMALGAAGRQVLTLVLAQGMRLVAAGLTIGFCGAWILSRLLRGMLPALAGFNWMPLAAATGLLLAVTLAACWTPARRATEADPATALRAD